MRISSWSGGSRETLDKIYHQSVSWDVSVVRSSLPTHLQSPASGSQVADSTVPPLLHHQVLQSPGVEAVGDRLKHAVILQVEATVVQRSDDERANISRKQEHRVLHSSFETQSLTI